MMLKTLWNKWQRFGVFLARLFGHAIFAVLYVFLFAPVALIAKLTGKRFLERFETPVHTFFTPKEKIRPTLDYMRRQW
ncbi:MAG: hypothetical protein N2Z21_03325 [Candidatus Sumerlaeaceae bacterium]|nr:hypothetical protein [Candidatus Sumerlaeaceae bacterium]